MREWSELEMSLTAGGFLSPSDGFCSAEQQFQYYGESVLLLLPRSGFAGWFLGVFFGLFEVGPRVK